MKKQVKIWGLIAIMLFLTMGFASCYKHKIYEKGYWQYIVVGKNSLFPKNKDDIEVAIVGLTESGKEQEALDVPRTIDGMEVSSFGHRRSRYEIESEKLKRLYIHDNIERIDYPSLYYFYFNNVKWECGEFPYEFKIIYSGYDEPIHYDWHIKTYIYMELYDEINKKYKEELAYKEELESYKYYWENESYYWFEVEFAPANVAFMNNYSEEINKGYYRADDIENGEKITEPPAPEREGYIFTGWYTEAEAINLWDFDNRIDMSDGEELRLYAGWRAI